MPVRALTCWTELVADPERIAAALSVGNWDEELLNPLHPLADEVVRVAKKLRDERKISEPQFVAVVMRWEPYADLRPFAGQLSLRTLPMFDRAWTANPEVRALLSPVGKRFTLQTLSEDQLETFFSKVARLSQSDLVLHEVTIPQQLVTEPMEMLMTLEVLGDLYPFLRRAENGDHIVLIPSVPVLQAFLIAKHGSNAIEVVPEIGLSELANIINQVREDKRCLGLAMPGIKLPRTIDRLRSNLTGFTWHDIFHAIKGSQLDKKYRRILFRGMDLANRAFAEATAAGMKIALAPGYEIDLKKIHPSTTPDEISERALDFIPLSLLEGLDESGALGARVLADFGLIDTGLSGLLVKDMAENPAWWRVHDIEPEALLHEMGPSAERLFEAVQAHVH